jgi:hypothetical protein
MTTESFGYLYHATSQRNYAKIATEGLLPGAYLGTEEIADYYAETIADEGEKPIILKLRLADIEHLDLDADHNGIAEPICYTLQKSEEDILAAWEACEGGWKDSFEIIQSLRCMSAIPAEHLMIADYKDEAEPQL